MIITDQTFGCLIIYHLAFRIGIRDNELWGYAVRLSTRELPYPPVESPALSTKKNEMIDLARLRTLNSWSCCRLRDSATSRSHDSLPPIDAAARGILIRAVQQLSARHCRNGLSVLKSSISVLTHATYRTWVRNLMIRTCKGSLPSTAHQNYIYVSLCVCVCEYIYI